MSDALSFSLSSLHKTLIASQPSTEYILAKLTPNTHTGPRVRLSTVLVLDVSGSMQGEPLLQVIRSAERLSELLSESDSLGVVVFSTEARVIAPLAPLTREHRRRLQQALTLLRATGGTNISAGLAMAATLFPIRAREERHNMLLLTDGHPTHGATTKEEFAKEVSRLRGQNIAVTSLGFGASHKEELLIEIAEAGGGRYFYISDAKLAEGNFAHALGAQRDVVVEQVKLSLKPAEGVQIVRVLGDPKLSFGADGLQVSLPDLLAGDALYILVELSLEPLSTRADWSPLHATLQAFHAVTHEPLKMSSTVSIQLAQTSSEVDAEVASALAIARAAELRDKARSLADIRDFKGAKAILLQAKATLEAAPGFVFGEESNLTDAWETITDDISAMEREPEQQEYQEFRKSQRDYLGFAAQGPSACGGGLRATPSAKEMADKLLKGPLPEAYIIISEKGGAPKRFQIDSPELTIGRVAGNGIVLPKGNVSKTNTKICFNDGAFWVIDMKSTNGTYINNRKLNGPHKLTSGDKICVGDFQIEFEGESCQTGEVASVAHTLAGNPSQPEMQFNRPQPAPPMPIRRPPVPAPNALSVAVMRQAYKPKG